MPELFGHFAFARIAQEIPAVARATRTPGLAALYYLGAAWPDLVTRPFHITIPYTKPYVEVFHAPMLFPVWAVLLAAWFAPPVRRHAAVALVLGMLTHMAIDLVQFHSTGGYLWLFPFSFQRSGWFGLIWAEDTMLWVTPPLCLAALALEWRRRSSQQRHDPRA